MTDEVVNLIIKKLKLASLLSIVGVLGPWRSKVDEVVNSTIKIYESILLI